MTRDRTEYLLLVSGQLSLLTPLSSLAGWVLDWWPFFLVALASYIGLFVTNSKLLVEKCKEPR